MKKVINKSLPKKLGVCYLGEDELYYSLNGYAFNEIDRRTLVVISKRNIPKEFYCEIIDNDIYIKYPIITLTEEEIIFDSETIGHYVFNDQYRELDIVEENIREVFATPNKTVLSETRNNIIENVVNSHELYLFLTEKFAKEPYYEKCLRKELLTQNPIKYFNIYLHKVNKGIELLLYNDMKNEVKYLFNNNIVCDEYGYELNAKTLKLSRLIGDISKGKGSLILTTSKLLAKFNFNEIESLIKIANYFKFSTLAYWESVTDLDVRLNDYSEYLLRSLLLTENIKSKNIFWSGAIEHTIIDFTRKLRDYLGLRRDDDELYPENLEEAHDYLVDETKRYEDKLRTKDKNESFAIMVEKYKDYCFEKDEYKFIIPETPSDLIQEGRKMHHCVGGYVDYVCSGRSKIVFLRKKEKPYMTIECVGNNIIQCKKFGNDTPNEEDAALIELWATKNRLEVKNY